MSDTSQGHGWWLASDGRWYPPELHPDRRPPAPSSPPPGVAPEAATGGPGEPPAATPAGVAAGVGPGAPPRASAPSLRWMTFLAAALVALAAVAVGVALTASTSSGGPGLPAGAGSGTITISSSASGPARFSGTVDGLTLEGTGTTTAGSPGDVGGAPAFELRGSLAGRSYDLHVTFSLPTTGDTADVSGFSFNVTGTYGTESVAGAADFTESNESGPTATVPFHGHVGSQTVAGTATASNPSSGPLRLTVHFTVVGSR